MELWLFYVIVIALSKPATLLPSLEKKERSPKELSFLPCVFASTVVVGDVPSYHLHHSFGLRWAI